MCNLVRCLAHNQPTVGMVILVFRLQMTYLNMHIRCFDCTHTQHFIARFLIEMVSIQHSLFNKFSPYFWIKEFTRTKPQLSRVCCVGPDLYPLIAQFLFYSKIENGMFSVRT